MSGTFLFLCALATAAAEPAFHVPFEKYKLANGMRVILSRDTSVPVTAVYVVYDVGARSEEKGRTGFAHLFEHMMFEGSANVKKSEHFKYVQSNGGEVNGSTHLDYTEYYEVMPSNKLELALWLESDRMRGLTITEENLRNQKDAVHQERLRNYDNQPYRAALADQWLPLIFGDFHNAHSTIGSPEDLNAATVADVSDFFRTYYAPNNAVLVISGDFAAAEAKKMVDRYFADIPSQRPPVRPNLGELPRAEGKTLMVTDERARIPAVVIGWPAPKRHSQDWYALDMLDAVLTSGQGARLRMELMKGRQSVLQVDENLGWPSSSPVDFKDPGYFTVILAHKPNFKGPEIVEQYQQVIDAIAETGIDSAEMNRARAVRRLENANSLQTALERARLLGIFEVLDGDPAMIDRSYASLLEVTAQQVQAAAKKYLTASRRDVMVIQAAGVGK
ncbi:MAG TPA: pitrilysin family protein [Bryobacteraceae bacterium]|nr:pitrilysin family protein [Bryobacteraceae bacterium]